MATKSAPWWSHPFWTISGWALGVIGTVLSVMFYLGSRQVKELAYTVERPSQIYDDRTTNLRVTKRSGVPIVDDVYLQEILIWNSGNLEIEPEDVRLPVEIVPVGTGGGAYPQSLIDVLEAKVVAQASPETSQAVVVYAPPGGGAARRLEWAHLDEHDAMKVQIIYSTPLESSLGFRLVGTIAGIDNIAKVPTELESDLRQITWGLYGLGVALLLIGVGVTYILTRRDLPNWLISVYFIVCGAVVIYIFFGSRIAIMPGRELPNL